MYSISSSTNVTKLIRNTIKNKRFVRYYAVPKSVPQMKVAICGAAGRVGQPLSLMLKQSSLVDELALLDISGSCGFGIELGHIDTKCKVNSFTSNDSIEEALGGAKVVVLLLAYSNTGHLPFDEMFKLNRGIIKDYTYQLAKFCPSVSGDPCPDKNIPPSNSCLLCTTQIQALLAVCTHPINCMVPIVSEVMKKCGNYNPHKIFGVTTLHVVRSNTFVGNVLGLEPECITVPVIGGGYERNVVPLLSLAKPCSEFTLAELQLLTNNIQMARNDIINVKRTEASTLAAAFSISRFVISLIKGLLGKPDIVECAFVKSVVHPQVKYLATPVQLGPGGLQRNLGIPEMTDYEKCLLDAAIKEINKDVRKAEQYMGVYESKECNPCDPDPKASKCPPDECKPRAVTD